MSQEFYLLVADYRPRLGRHAKRGCPLMVWWGPNDSGYANSLAWAGKYAAEVLAARLWYYQPGVRTWAIPCEAAERFSVPKPDASTSEDPKRRAFGQWCDGPGPIVPNHSVIWDLLEAEAWTESRLRSSVVVEACK